MVRWLAESAGETRFWNFIKKTKYETELRRFTEKIGSSNANKCIDQLQNLKLVERMLLCTHGTHDRADLRKRVLARLCHQTLLMSNMST